MQSGWQDCLERVFQANSSNSRMGDPTQGVAYENEDYLNMDQLLIPRSLEKAFWEAHHSDVWMGITIFGFPCSAIAAVDDNGSRALDRPRQDEALDRRILPEGPADGPRQRLRPVDDEQLRHRRVEAARHQVVEKRLHHRGVLGHYVGSRWAAPILNRDWDIDCRKHHHGWCFEQSMY